jgi:hypothetical protein
MRKLLGALVVAVAAVAVVQAHALYILPDGEKITVVFSDDLAPDANIKEATWKRVAGLKLTAVANDGARTKVTLTQEKDHLKATVPAGTVEVSGAVEYGVFAKGEGKPTLLKYYPRAVLGEVKPGPRAANREPRVEDPVAKLFEFGIMPVKNAAGKVYFQVVMNGKPVAKSKVSVIAPKKDAEDVTTDDEGRTPAFDAAGRYGVTARVSVDKEGEVNGQKYEVVTHVATLVVDIK